MNSSLPLSDIDPEVHNAILKERERQNNSIELIASENSTSNAVLEAQGSIFSNKYAEGYPGRRYYDGCDNIDTIETLAIERVKELFGCNFANVQPHSGATANQAVFYTFLQPGDTIAGLALDCGGHLTHGSKVTMSGKWFNSVQYHVDKDGIIDYDELEKIAQEEKPKMIISGTSSYSRVIDWARFRKIADSIGAILLADIAHVAGLVATGDYPSPFPHAHVVTTTTHKTLRGPRGGVILWNDEDYTKKINSSVFPGVLGGPLMHTVSAKAVAFKEALSSEFKAYSKQVIANAKFSSDLFQKAGLKVVTGGTDCHMFVVDLTPYNITGRKTAKILHEAGLTYNCNTIPFDTRSPFVTSGIRVGTSAATSRGFKEPEMEKVVNWSVEILQALRDETLDESLTQRIAKEVSDLCQKFPLWYK